MRNEEQDNAPAEDERGVVVLIRKVEEKEKEVWRCLNPPRSSLRDRLIGGDSTLRAKHPVTTYHLEQIASHLHSILFYVKSQRGKLNEDEWGQASLRSLLDQLENPSQLSGAGAWELAGEFERQLIDLGDDIYLYTLLKDQIGSAEDLNSGPKRVPTIANWRDYFPSEELERLRDDYEENGRRFSNDRTLSEVRDALRHLHLARFEEYRRYRTKLRLRTRYLLRMTPWLVGLLIILCVSYLLTSLQNTCVLESLDPLDMKKVKLITTDPLPPPSDRRTEFVAYLLFFVFSAGALGAVLGRAFTLGKQFPREGTAATDDEASFGIRWLLAVGYGMRAQVVIGGTAAVVIFLALQLFDPSFPSVAYGTIGFLTGYSEPFFSRTLQETTAWGQRIGGLACSNAQ
jgi:hypothetical protein